MRDHEREVYEIENVEGLQLIMYSWGNEFLMCGERTKGSLRSQGQGQEGSVFVSSGLLLLLLLYF